LRRFIEVEPVLDFTALEPGRAATNAITQTAQKLDLTGSYQAHVRLTGLVPINDDGFATLKHHWALNVAVTIFAVLVILWLALHSLRIIGAVAVSLIVGLPVTAAVGLMLVGALNLISVAFFILFIGLGVDFGLQFCVRYRAERHDYGDLRAGLRSAARKAGVPFGPGYGRNCRWFCVLRAHRIPGSGGARPNRRLWHDHCLSYFDHRVAGAVECATSAR
jgi:hypothetical protein